MKASTVAVFGGLATLAAATRDHYQNQQDTYPIAKTVTVTQPYVSTETLAPGSYPSGAPPSPYNPGQDHQAAVTVTITESAAPTTGAAYGARQTHRVEVGTFNGEVKFVPNQVNAEIGDVVEYDFLAQSHSLTQSEFLTPCTYNGGFDTNLNQPNPKNESGLFVVPFEVTTKKPQWFYCKQAGPPNHCGKGMVFGLNPGNKMDQFIQNAIKQNGNLAAGPASTGQIPTPTGAYASATSTASGAVATVTVGLEKGTVLKFDPPYLPKVAAGQTIHFDFRAVNHTLTESSLANPCTKLEGTEVDTNFQNVNKDDIPEFKPFDLTIDSDKTRYFYCKQANKTPNGHCSKGMVFAVNIDEATFRQFERNALATLPRIKGRYAA